MVKYPHINRSTLSGLAATLVGNGIGRFAFIAIFPVLVSQAWFSYSQVSYLGAFTLLGYLLGIPLNHYFSKRVSATTLLRLSMLFCSISYFACSWQSAGFYWFVFWRTVVGICGAILMVVAPHIVLARCEASQRTRFSGVIFSGIGIGVMASGTIVPLMLHVGLKATWITLGIICLLLTYFTWNEWSVSLSKQNNAAASHAITNDTHPFARKLSIVCLLIAYALNAVAYLPHTLFWVVYINQELHMSMAAAGFFWAIFGIGAAMGPFITSTLSSYFDLSKALLISFILKSFGVLLPLLGHSIPSLFFSSLLVGMFTPGIANLVSSYSMKLSGITHYKRTWGWMTFSFAFTQALFGYVMVYMMSIQKSYQILFTISFISLIISSACIVMLMLCEQKQAFYKLAVNSNIS